ncbi:hypothetical protein [Nonomuraea sp. SYSU D8015]|uniref:hypothetical protein n=1 Tax=Nonomuraea sp. SYSU D8015 TaxID=2593644 RepID=UPI001660D720|nr:hypothetical protein [Nonomuraea sp. SYSU D8015]
MTTTTSSLLADLDALPVLWEVDGTVAAPVEAVAGLLFAIEDGRVGDDNLLVLAGSWAARRGAMTVSAVGAGSYHAEFAGAPGPVRVELHRGLCAMAVQSWYGGVHEALPSAGGTRVVHRVHQVLPEHPGFRAGIAELGMHVRMSRDLQRVLRAIADRLGC